MISRLNKTHHLSVFMMMLLCAALTLAPLTMANGNRVNHVSAATARQQSDARTITATQNVAVIFDFDLTSVDTIRVRGWNRAEVQIQTAPTEVILRRADSTNASAPATRVVVVAEPADNFVSSDDVVSREVEEDGTDEIIEVNVPRGATIQVRARKANVSVSDVAEANIQAMQGDTMVERAARAVEINAVSGDINVIDSSGRARLQSVSGDVEASGGRAAEAGDAFQATSISGDVALENIKHTQIEIETVSGEITFDGALAQGARLRAKTTSGDISLALPADASFQINASVSLGGFNSDFPFALTSSSTRTASLQLRGTQGAGDAKLDLASHSGEVRLHRKK